MHLLEAVATAEQKERYLRPLAAGESRSCFAMTEPAPGAGSDPAALRTRAARAPGGWRIDGRKWFITGAEGAGFAICMARTSGEPGDRGGATMFLVDADNPGMRIDRHIETLDESLYGGHCEMTFDGCLVPDDAVLGEVDQGYRYAQVRLGPARMTHCMRWLGIARRAQDVAVARAAERELFGSRLGDLGMVQAMIADNEIDIAASRGLIRQACWELDRGAGRGPGAADLRLAGGLRRRAAGAVPAGGAAVPDLRRAVRDPPVGDRETGGRRGGAGAMTDGGARPTRRRLAPCRVRRAC
jgi:acyl-CoA dehydrogenase